jgi:rRNA pseudouridine-1189 N-methylase Emg1 (Nep1/Mra1 family)
MVSILLADTDPNLKDLKEVENICHAVGLSLIIRHKGEDLAEIFELIDCPSVAFTPKGKLSAEEMVKKYGGDVMLVIGGFSEHKDLSKGIYKHVSDTVSLGKEFLTIPQVIEKIIEAYEKEAERRGAGNRPGKD